MASAAVGTNGSKGSYTCSRIRLKSVVMSMTLLSSSGILTTLQSLARVVLEDSWISIFVDTSILQILLHGWPERERDAPERCGLCACASKFNHKNSINNVKKKIKVVKKIDAGGLEKLIKKFVWP